jgi:AraC family transcriptional regulator
MPTYGTVSTSTRHRQAVAGGFVITEASFAPFERLAPHTHDQPSLTFVLDGNFRERIGTRGEDLVPASLLIKPGDMDHGDEMGRHGARILFVEPTAENDQQLRDAEAVFRVVTHARQERIGRIGRHLAEARWDVDPVARLLAEGLVLEMLALAHRSVAPGSGTPPAWLRTMRDRLAADFVSPPSIAALALEAGVHPSYAVRAFGRHYGVRPGDFVQQCRLERAMWSLRMTDQSLAQIAIQTGFADQSHFGRMFKRHVGTTPSLYRRECRNTPSAGGVRD